MHQNKIFLYMIELKQLFVFQICHVPLSNYFDFIRMCLICSYYTTKCNFVTIICLYENISKICEQGNYKCKYIKMLMFGLSTFLEKVKMKYYADH